MSVKFKIHFLGPFGTIEEIRQFTLKEPSATDFQCLKSKVRSIYFGICMCISIAESRKEYCCLATLTKTRIIS